MRTNCPISDERRNRILRTSSLKCPKVETGPPGEPKTGPERAETKRRARSTKNAPSAPTSMPAESSAGAQTLVVAPLRAAGNQPHGNPSYHPSCNRQPNARYALHNRIDNHHPALLSAIDTGARLIPTWPVESPRASLQAMPRPNRVAHDALAHEVRHKEVASVRHDEYDRREPNRTTDSKPAEELDELDNHA